MTRLTKATTTFRTAREKVGNNTNYYFVEMLNTKFI